MQFPNYTSPIGLLPRGRDLRGHGAGSRWCSSLDELSSFESYLQAHAALRAITGIEPVEVAVSYEYV